MRGCLRQASVEALDILIERLGNIRQKYIPSEHLLPFCNHLLGIACNNGSRNICWVGESDSFILTNSLSDGQQISLLRILSGIPLDEWAGITTQIAECIYP